MRSGTISRCRMSSSSRVCDRASRCGEFSGSDQSIFDRSNVARSVGSGIVCDICGSVKALKRLNSPRRPSRTAFARSGSFSKSTKNWNGVEAAHSSPMNIRGICGASRKSACARARRSGGMRCERRSPKARLPIWSWFCRNATKADRGQVARGFAACDAVLVRRGIALIGEALRKRSREMLERPVRIIFVVAFVLSRQESMPGIVDVVRPLRGMKARAPVGLSAEPARLVGFVLEDEMDVAIRDSFAGCGSQAPR